MGPTQEPLIAEAGSSAGSDARGCCPRCGEPPDRLPPVVTSLLAGAPVRRCNRCGTRATLAPSSRLVFSCESCGLPFLADELLPHAQQRCADCRSERLPQELPDAALAAATAAEVRSALGQAWKFVGAPGVAAYLNRVTRQAARWIEGAPALSRVLLFEDASLRTLALPPGLLLVSVSTLHSLEDEAELLFVLGHELSHATADDAAVRLVRLGLHSMARGPRGAGSDAWTQAAVDLIRMGYGRRRERDADARAIDVMLATGYDPEAAVRYLQRLQARISRGDPTVAELALAHPPPHDRIRRIEKALFGREAAGTIVRVNRELFRRAAGHSVLASQLAADHPLDDLGRGRADRTWLQSRLLWVGLGLLLLLAALVSLGLLLVR